MKKIALMLGLSVLGLALAAPPVDARGCRSAGCCYTTCCAVSYVDQACTGYRCVVKYKPIQVNVTEMVTKVVDEPCKYTVYEPVKVAHKRTVTCYKQVVVEEPFTYTIYEPVHTKQKVKVTTYTCKPKEVVRKVTTCHYTYCYSHGCGGCCYPVCCPVYTTQDVRCIVHECVPVVTEQEVTVCNYVPKQVQGKRHVCRLVAEPREETYYTCNYVAKEVTAVRKRYLCEPVAKTVTVQQAYTEMVPYTYTVRVPVYSHCAPVYHHGCYHGGCCR